VNAAHGEVLPQFLWHGRPWFGSPFLEGHMGWVCSFGGCVWGFVPDRPSSGIS
jgi:hypothetical protein